MGTLTSVAFAAAVNIRFRSFHRENIKTTLPKWQKRLCFSCREDSNRFRVVKCLSNDENSNKDDSVGENEDTKDSIVKTALREEDDETSISSSSNEFGSDKTSSVSSRVHTYL